MIKKVGSLYKITYIKSFDCLYPISASCWVSHNKSNFTTLKENSYFLILEIYKNLSDLCKCTECFNFFYSISFKESTQDYINIAECFALKVIHNGKFGIIFYPNFLLKEIT